MPTLSPRPCVSLHNKFNCRVTFWLSPRLMTPNAKISRPSMAQCDGQNCTCAVRHIDGRASCSILLSTIAQAIPANLLYGPLAQHLGTDRGSVAQSSIWLHSPRQSMMNKRASATTQIILYAWRRQERHGSGGYSAINSTYLLHRCARRQQVHGPAVER